MKFLSPAKVNLYLKITGKDPEDGYHYIESVFDPVSLYDVLYMKVSRRPGIRLVDHNKALNIPPEKNIVYKAVKMVLDKYKILLISLKHLLAPCLEPKSP